MRWHACSRADHRLICKRRLYDSDGSFHCSYLTIFESRAVKASHFMDRLWEAIQVWREDLVNRKLYWCRAGPACLHLSVFTPGEHHKVCRSKHPPLLSEDYKSIDAGSADNQNMRFCRHMWGFWEECSAADYRLFERAAETNNKEELLAFVFEQVSLNCLLAVS